MKLFVMSDIHSFYDEMITALDLKGFDEDDPNHILVICGDLFDRGPDAKKVLAYAKKMAAADRLIYITGNHEELLFDCIKDIKHGGVSAHHISNGTLDTICQMTGMGKYDLYGGFYDRDKFDEAIAELTDFIADNAVDYAEIGEYIFVHGWIPCDPISGHVAEDWRDGDWEQARWYNGMSAWNRGAVVKGGTIVCGHYHTSWGHSNLRREYKEFPQKNRKDWQKSFEPFIDEGIIAIDACTAYSGFCNCLVIEQ